MKTQPTDPVISEVRAVRDAHAAQFDYDVAAIFRNIREMQEASGREFVRSPARRTVATDVASAKHARSAGD